MARAIAGAADVLELDRVVIGGGVAQAGSLLFDPLRRELRRRARLAFLADLDVVPAALGQEAGAIGAAALAFQQMPGV
jgi:glucokinase